MLQVHARNSEFNLNLIDSGNCNRNRGSAIQTSNGHDMLSAFERVVSDVLLIECAFEINHFEMKFIFALNPHLKSRDLIVDSALRKTRISALASSIDKKCIFTDRSCMILRSKRFLYRFSL